MAKVLVNREFDEFSQIYEDFYFDEATGEVTIQRWQNIDKHAAYVRDVRNDSPDNFSGSKHGIFAAASVPSIEVERWKTEMGFDWNKADNNERRKWLNKSENAHWKLRNAHL